MTAMMYHWIESIQKTFYSLVVKFVIFYIMHLLDDILNEINFICGERLACFSLTETHTMYM